MPKHPEATLAAALVREAQSVAVIGHIRPDADAIGSVCAVLLALDHIGIEASGWIGQREDFSANLRTIPAAHRVRSALELPLADAYVVVDCGSIDRTGAFAAALSRTQAPVVVFDHHASNSGFGTAAVIDTAAESTTTILRQWLPLLGVTLNRELAHALYAGLVTDTGSFRWGRPEMHSLAAELVSYGIDTRQIAAELIDDVSLDGLKMVGRVLSGAQVREVGVHRLAVLQASYADIAGLQTSEVEGLVEFARAVADADLGAVFKEYRPGWFAVSLRTSADLDVSRIAGALGGGGHRQAAGYTCEGTFAACLAQLEQAIRDGQ